MKIAIIGTGNVGGALAEGWSKQGHEILLGVRDPNQFKGKELLQLPSVTVHPIADATKLAEVIVLSTPAKEVIHVTKSSYNFV